jgi:hypothetical protein
MRTVSLPLQSGSLHANTALGPAGAGTVRVFRLGVGEGWVFFLAAGGSAHFHPSPRQGAYISVLSWEPG